MFVVEADVVGEDVEGAVVGESFGYGDGGVFCDAGLLIKDVVLGDEMPCAGMEGACEERAGD